MLKPDPRSRGNMRPMPVQTSVPTPAGNIFISFKRFVKKTFKKALERPEAIVRRN